MSRLTPNQLLKRWNALAQHPNLESQVYELLAGDLLSEFGYEDALLSLRALNDDPEAPKSVRAERPDPVDARFAWRTVVRQIALVVYATHVNGHRGTPVRSSTLTIPEFADWNVEWTRAKWLVAGLDAEAASVATRLELGA